MDKVSRENANLTTASKTAICQWALIVSAIQGILTMKAGKRLKFSRQKALFGNEVKSTVGYKFGFVLRFVDRVVTLCVVFCMGSLG